MNEKPSPFAAIFAGGDPHGLLGGKTPGAARASEDEIAISNFEAINAFIDQHGILPGTTDDGREPGLSEYTLETHLDAFRDGSAYHDLLAPFDRHGLLGTPVAVAAAPATMAELIASGDPLLYDSAEQIFTLSHVEPPSPKTAPDAIAKRHPCEDFADFAAIFATLKADLASGRRKASPFEGEGSIKPGTAFIFHGLMAYIAEVDAKERRGKNYNARTRVIFGNGTESNLLLRSFARALYDDNTPRQIIETAPAASGPLFSGEAESGKPDDRLTGSIYIVESLSAEPSIAALRGRLYKVGFTTLSVQDRLANVEADPTFLLAPVNIVTVFDTVNLNPRKLENLIHQFFAHARLRIEVLLGRTVSPQEWFVVPIELVREAIDRILDGTIVNYRYDHLSRKIVLR
jgi:hypothetical protein